MRRVALVCATALTSTAWAVMAGPRRPTRRRRIRRIRQTPATVTADGLPTAQIDGVVWTRRSPATPSTPAASSPTPARPGGGGHREIPRNNLMAYNINTGAAAPRSRPRSTPRSARSRRRPTAHGLRRRQLHHHRRADAEPDRGVRHRDGRADLHLRAPGQLRRLRHRRDRHHGLRRRRLPGCRHQRPRTTWRRSTPTNGALLDWAPDAEGGRVWALALSPDGTKVVVGGQFTTLNGSPTPATGWAWSTPSPARACRWRSTPTSATAATTPASPRSRTSTATTSTAAATRSAAAATSRATSRASWDGGTINWIDDCHGDTYAVYPTRQRRLRRRPHRTTAATSAASPTPTPLDLAPRYWRSAPSRPARPSTDPYGYHNFQGQPQPAACSTGSPTINAGTFTGMKQGAWSVTGNSHYVVLGGEFTKVNGKAQQGLVRFADSLDRAERAGPALFNTTWPIRVNSTASGHGPDQLADQRGPGQREPDLQVYRDVAPRPAWSTRPRPARVLERLHDRLHRHRAGARVDPPVPGAGHRPVRQHRNSAWTSVTVGIADGPSTARTCRRSYDSQPPDFWRFDEPPAPRPADLVGTNP